MITKVFTLFKITMWFAVSIMLLFYCATDPLPSTWVKGGNICIDFDQSLNSRVAAVFNGKKYLSDNYLPSEFVTISGNMMNDFTFTGKTVENVDDNIGPRKNHYLSKRIIIEQGSFCYRL